MEHSDSHRWRQWQSWAWLLGIFTLLGLYGLANNLILSLQVGDRPTLDPQAVLKNFLLVYFWALSVPLIWTLKGRLHGRKLSWSRGITGHLAASFIYLSLYVLFLVAVSWGVQAFQNASLASLSTLVKGSATSITSSWFAFWLIIGAFHGIDAYRRWHEQRSQASRLREQLAQARLEALQMQLQPHFMFNTLNAISTLVHDDPETADRMIARFAELLRVSLDRSNQMEIPLAQELTWIERYLDILRMRFGDRLTVRWAIEPDVTDARVPPLILQPLVENAVRHGVERCDKAEPGEVSISAWRSDDRLHLSVQDNGRGWSDERRNGLGLGNVRERLEQLHGAAGRVALTQADDGGMEAKITLPWRAEEREESADGA